MRLTKSNIIKAILFIIAILPANIFISNSIINKHYSDKSVVIKYRTENPQNVSFHKWQGFLNYEKYNDSRRFSNNFYYSKIDITENDIERNLLILNDNVNSNIDIYSIQFNSDNNTKKYKEKDLKYILVPPTYNTLIKSTDSCYSIKNNILPSEVVTKTSLEQFFFNNFHIPKLIKACCIASLFIFVIFLLIISYSTKLAIIRVKYLLFIVFFSTTISTPLFVDINISPEPTGRIDVTKPNIRENDIFNYMRKYSKYFANSFGFRNDLIAINSNLKYSLFKKSSIPDIVSIGKNNWLFYTHYFNDESSYTEDELGIIKTNLEYHKSKLDSLGIKFYVFCPPTKDKIYNELLPNNTLIKTKTRKIDQIISYLENNSDIIIIDPIKNLLEAKNKDIVYYPNDTHWNFHGGLIGVNTLLNEINKDFSNVTPYNIDSLEKEATYSCGDLGGMLNVKDFIYDKNFKYKIDFCNNTKLDTSINSKYKDPSHISLIKASNPDTLLPNILFVRDSYSVACIPFVIKKFNNSFFLWSQNHLFDYNIIKEEKPDILVLEILEFYLDDLLIEPHSI